jgi:uncharacterized damage-inducible protein DinB
MTPATSEMRSTRPAPDEHAPYYGRYIERVPPGDVVAQLRSQIAGTLALLRPLSEEKAGYRYAPGKWSIRQVIGHLTDTERVFCYRAMWFARSDGTALPGFDENAFVANARFDSRSLASLVDELAAQRGATVAFFASLDADEWTRRGVANDKEMSVRALAWTIAGHELHHRELLRTRYQL